MRLSRLLVLLAVAVAAVMTQPAVASASGPTRFVRDAAGFARAVDSLRWTGGRIILLPHLYGRQLRVGPSRSGTLTITGTKGARVQSLFLDRTRNVNVVGVRIAPVNGDAQLLSSYSQHIVLDHLTVTAYRTRSRSGVSLLHSNDVTVRSSTFAHCGDRDPDWSFCLLPKRADHVSIYDNTFHDCRGCDFIHGRFGSVGTIRDNTFDRALQCNYGWVKCGHQDLIELFAADRLLVTRNRFGVSQRGGAQFYITGNADQITVTNNVFLNTDPKAPGVTPRVGILIGTRMAERLPLAVSIVNNTILSGKLRVGIHNASSITLSPNYVSIPLADRPLIANNIEAHLEEPGIVCTQARVSANNLIETGGGCSGTNATGSANLDPLGRPTAASVLVIGKADPALATPRDFTDALRDAQPDIGAYEYR